MKKCNEMLMKLGLKMVIIGLFIFVIAVLALPAWADVMPMSGGSNALIFKKSSHKNQAGNPDKEYIEKDIVLDKEKLFITLNEREAKVQAFFWLKNTSSEAQWRSVAFPLGGGHGSAIIIRPTSFSATAEGHDYYTEKASIPQAGNTGWTASAQRQKEWTMSFPPHYTMPLTVTYTQPLMRDFWYGTAATRDFFYVLQSGGKWKDDIRHFELVITWENIEPWQRIAVTNKDLWKNDTFEKTGRISPELDLAADQITLTKENLKLECYGIHFVILVKAGTPNAYPPLDQELKECLMGVYDSMGHTKARKKWVMAGNVFYDRGDAEKAIYYWKKELAKTSPSPDFRPEALFGLALLHEQRQDYDKSLKYYRKFIQGYDSESIKRDHWYGSTLIWMRRSALEGEKRVKFLMQKGHEYK